MKQTIYLEHPDMQALLRGEALTIVVGSTQVPIMLDPSSAWTQVARQVLAERKNGHEPTGSSLDRTVRHIARKARRVAKAKGKLRRVQATAPDGSRHTVDERVAAHWRNLRKGQKRREFTDEQRLGAVARVRRGESQSAVAKALRISDGLMSAWMRMYPQAAPAGKDGVERVGKDGRRFYSAAFKANVLADRKPDESLAAFARRHNLPPGTRWLAGKEEN